MDQRIKGISCAALSAVLFGFNPILSLGVYGNGGDAASVTCIRSFIALFIHYYLFKRSGGTLRLNKQEAVEILLVSVIGISLTDLFISASYVYIPGGLATTLHFTYPVLSVLCEVVLFRERLSKTALIALISVTAGITMFSWRNLSIQLTGVLLALLSGVCYTFYLVMAARSSLKDMDVHKLLFYICTIEAIFLGGVGLVTGASFRLNGQAWFYAFLLAILTNVGAGILMQNGIRLAGLTLASMLSTLEPLTSVVAGILLCGDIFGAAEISGCIMVLAGILLLVKGQQKSRSCCSGR